MPKILELDQHVADLIAAGEVVQRPASVVKELTENAVDSGASIITVEISSGGMAYIRVTDNGCGIANDDVKTAFLRHATSKLRDARGLEAIGTLGFRGEALAAIAAVSRVELLTREQGADEGVSLFLEAGKVIRMSPAGCPEGTTIIVRDLFYNTPARLKFVKTDRAEGSAVSSIVLKSALSRPDISFRYIKDNKSEYHTPGDSRIDSCIYSLLGREIEAGFIKVNSSDHNVSVKGYVSSPETARGNRSYQFFFVNERPVFSLMLQSALEQAFKNILPPGRFPSCVLYISLKPNEVDVNVHPAKTEVKFISDKQVFDAVYYAALSASDKKIISDNYSTPVENNIKSENVISITPSVQTELISEPRVSYKSDNLFKTINPVINIDSAKHLPAQPPAPQVSPIAQVSQNPAGSFRFIGEALNMYIIIEHENSIWYIDKHAAHERIHFDALNNKNYESMSESLITPVVCRFGHEDVSVLLENSDLLENLGFSVEGFGEDAVAVRNIPAEIDIGDTEPVLSDICMQLKYGGTFKSSLLDKIYKIIACKAAIKAGRASGRAELEALAESVMSGDISHCPHGRPVAFEVTKTTLDKGFGRI